MDREELFNLRHAQARNVIERIFGVVKKRFRALQWGLEYKHDKNLQNIIPSALIAIHNFIRYYDPNEGKLPGFEEPLADPGDDTGDIEAYGVTQLQPTTVAQHQSAAAARRAVDDRRDQIAQAMWDSYQEVLMQRSQETGYNINGYLYNIENMDTISLLGNNENEDERQTDDDEGAGNEGEDGGNEEGGENSGETM